MMFASGPRLPFPKWFPWAFLFLLAAVWASAEENRVYLNRFWQTSEGMPSNVVNDTAKDRDGFLWIATSAGVTRFDGLRFEVFTSADGLPDTQIMCLHIDRAGRIWIGTRRGAAYRENGIWKIPPGQPATSVFSLGEGGDGSIWLGTYIGCWRWMEGSFTRINLGSVTPDVRAFLREGAGGMWILTRDNLCQWQAGQAGPAQEIAGPWQGKDLRDLTRDREDRIILCGTGVLLRLQNKAWEDLTPLIPGGGKNANLACIVAQDDTLWVATRNHGLVFLKGRETGSVEATTGLSLDDVRSVVMDGQGILWAGTNGGGINRLLRRNFDTYSSHEGLGRTVTSAIAITRTGTVLAGTDGGGIFQKTMGTFTPGWQNAGLPGDGLIWSLCALSDDSLWVGTYRDGLFRILNNKADHLPVPSRMAGNAISALHETRDGGVLIGTHNAGVWKWRDGQFDDSVHAPVSEHEHVVYDVLEDRQGRLWAATGTYGLWLNENGTWQEITRGLGMPDLLATVLHESANGDLWIGSLGQGLARYRGKGLSKWNATDGLISDNISQILEDDDGYLWLGSDRGLQRIALSALQAERSAAAKLPLESLRFSREDGLPTPQFSGEHGNLAARAPDGSLWFSLASGAVRVDPRQISSNHSAPIVRIENAASDRGTLWTSDGFGKTDQITVPPGSGTLQLRFTSPDFLNPERSRFHSRMAGLENEWQEIEGSRSVSYASLPPGTYQFEVAAAASDGTWSPQPTSVSVIIQPWFWQTLAFRTGLSLAILTVLGWLLRMWLSKRFRRRLALVEQERRIDKERARIARDLHDELGASLTEINFLGTLTADAMTDPTSRSRVEGMVDRAQRMAKSLDEIVWTVNPANDSLSSTANYLCSRTEESLATAAIRCRLEIDDVLPQIPIDSELRHHLLMAVNEAVHNVMKHSRATECTLFLHLVDHTLMVSVADNGCGFLPAAEPGRRNGLVNLERRMEATAGSVEITTTPQGTTVSLRIPLPKPGPA